MSLLAVMVLVHAVSTFAVLGILYYELGSEEHAASAKARLFELDVRGVASPVHYKAQVQ